MTVRRLTKKDYEQVILWWKAQGRAILAWEVLPHLGFITEDDGVLIACSWLYCSDSVTGFVSFTTVNPEANRRKLPGALDLLRQAEEEAGRVAGLKLLFQFSGGGGFTRFLVKSGWKDTLIKHDFLMKEI